MPLKEQEIAWINAAGIPVTNFNAAVAMNPDGSICCSSIFGVGIFEFGNAPTDDELRLIANFQEARFRGICEGNETQLRNILDRKPFPHDEESWGIVLAKGPSEPWRLEGALWYFRRPNWHDKQWEPGETVRKKKFPHGMWSLMEVLSLIAPDWPKFHPLPLQSPSP